MSIVELESPSNRLLEIVRTALGVAATAKAADKLAPRNLEPHRDRAVLEPAERGQRPA